VQLRGGILSEKQKLGVQLAVRSAPLMTGSAVHSNMRNFSPAKHIDSTKPKRQAVDRLVLKEPERQALMSKRLDGVDLDGSFGSRLTLTMDMSLSRFIKKHHDPADPYHLNEARGCHMWLSVFQGRDFPQHHHSASLAELGARRELLMAEARSLRWHVQPLLLGVRPHRRRYEQHGRTLQSGLWRGNQGFFSCIMCGHVPHIARGCHVRFPWMWLLPHDQRSSVTAAYEATPPVGRCTLQAFPTDQAIKRQQQAVLRVGDGGPRKHSVKTFLFSNAGSTYQVF
jgi:hypothetical protein